MIKKNKRANVGRKHSVVIRFVVVVVVVAVACFALPPGVPIVGNHGNFPNIGNKESVVKNGKEVTGGRGQY